MSGLLNFRTLLKMIFGCAFFALGFDLFLRPNGLNAGGLSGFSMVITSVVKFGTIGIFTAILNIPLFAVSGIRIGRRFFILSLVGMALVSALIDAFSYLPVPETDPIIASLYGGALCGIGTGAVYTTGGTTGGIDILARLLKYRWQNVSIGLLVTCIDLVVAALTGFVFGDLNLTLYCGVAIIVSGQIVDAVVYRFDYSKVAMVISSEHTAIAGVIVNQLGRGATYLKGEGCFSGKERKVVLTAVKRNQLTELKRLVAKVDPNAFVIVQEAHQVLGDGFARYSEDSL